MEVDETITLHPTQLTPGEKLIDKICHYCGFRRSESIILPTLPQDTHSQYNAIESNTSYTSGFDSGGSSFDSGGSSGGSFDGGSSSGDGASGSW
jgi:uncharacterized protein